MNAYTYAYGGFGGEGDLYSLGTDGDGGMASATTDVTALSATYSSVNATAYGGNSGDYYSSTGAGQNGDATARATLTVDGTLQSRADATATATGGGFPYDGADGKAGAADAHAEIFGGVFGTTTGGARATSYSGESSGIVSSQADAPVGGPASATSHTSEGTTVTPGDYAISAGNMLSTAVLAPVSPAFNDGLQTYGYGAFATGYGGEGESLTYTGYSTFAFGPLDGGPLAFDFLTFGDVLDGFESLSLTIDGNSFGFYQSYFFDTLADFGTLFDMDILLSASVSDPVFVGISYSFVSSTPGQGFGFDYRLVGDAAPPVAPIPVPAALPMLASALAALGLLLRRRRRIAA